MNLYYATHRLDDLLKQHFETTSGSPRKLPLEFSSLSPWHRFKSGAYRRMDGFRTLDPAKCELPVWLNELQTAVTEFLTLATSSTAFRRRAVDFGNAKWIKDLEGKDEDDYERYSSADPELKFQATLTLVPYDPEWLPVREVDAEATHNNGLPAIRMEDKAILLDGKLHHVDDEQVLAAVQLLIQGYPNWVKGTVIEKRTRVSRGKAGNLFRRSVWQRQPPSLRNHIESLPGSGFRWV